MANSNPPAALDDKPLPDPATTRPGTSGTELNLRTNREKASTAFQRAQKAEQAYRAKRQATNARKDVAACKEHFKQGFRHLKLGTGCALRVMKAVPAVVKEKEVARKEKAEAGKRKKAEEKKRKLDEELKNSEVGSAAPEDGEAATAVV